MKDELFGELSYDYGWCGSVQLDCFGRTADVAVLVSAEEDEPISDYQRSCFLRFLQSWGELREDVREQIFSYYRETAAELGFADGENPDYPLLDDPSELIEMIHLDLVNLFCEGVLDGRCVGLAFSCSWDAENGLGVLLVNEQVRKIGYQDVAF